MGDAAAKCRVSLTPTTFGKADPTLPVALEKAVAEVIYTDHGRPPRSFVSC